ncbi:MAG: hypothetical protein PHZ26_00955 [Candidatus Gracilibacteria bacterium]|nr:hypothetical protein [Candidatus Gracilibacteria bacterium]MDD2908303.1 hypothetical protein [Candidatus Gracilibacteria bacterium]
MKNKKGFSVIIALLITAFLIILSSGILTIVVQETKNTRLVFNAISTYAGAEGTTEYALLKIKNHGEGFQDNIIENSNDNDINLFAKNINNITLKDQKISYSIENYSKNYIGHINKGDFEIIPLFYDEGQKISPNSKNPNVLTSNFIKANSFKLSGSGNYLWNIIGNNLSGVTFGITGSGTISKTIGTGYTGLNELMGIQKEILDDSDVLGDVKKIKLSTKSIGDFLDENENNYLIIYSNSDLDYSLESEEGFSLPKLKVTASSRINDFKQNLEFSEDKNKYFDALKYSLFSK